MSDPTNTTAPFDSVGAKRLLDQFAVSQAVELALSGDYTSAESLLKGLIQRSDAPTEALDILAKVFVQQGRVLDAGALWRRALEKDPANPAYQAALTRLNQMQRRPVWLTFLWPAALTLVVIVSCLAALQIQSGRHRIELAHLEGRIDRASETAARADDVGRLSQSLNDLKAQQRDLQGQVEQARRDLRGLASTTAAIAKTSRELLAAWSRLNSLGFAPDTPQAVPNGVSATASSPLRLDIQIAGIVATQQHEHCIVRFEAGLFDHADHFKSGSEALLDSLAKSLVRSPERLIIEIIGGIADEGHDAPSATALDRDAIGRARAKRIEQFLTRLGLFPPGALRTASGTNKDPLFPTEDALDRSPDRGVFLRISRAAGPRNSDEW